MAATDGQRAAAWLCWGLALLLSGYAAYGIVDLFTERAEYGNLGSVGAVWAVPGVAMFVFVSALFLFLSLLFPTRRPRVVTALAVNNLMLLTSLIWITEA